jgi:hypothetical protein
MEVAPIWRLTMTEVRTWKVVGLDWVWKAVGPRATALPQHEVVCGEKHYLSDCSHIGKDEAFVLSSEYKKTRDADKKEANFKTLGNNRATADNRDG